jgi:hypothetical protein
MPEEADCQTELQWRWSDFQLVQMSQLADLLYFTNLLNSAESMLKV